MTARWASWGKSMMLAPLPVLPSASMISSRPSRKDRRSVPPIERGKALRADDLDALRIARDRRPSSSSAFPARRCPVAAAPRHRSSVSMRCRSVVRTSRSRQRRRRRPASGTGRASGSPGSAGRRRRPAPACRGPARRNSSAGATRARTGSRPAPCRALPRRARCLQPQAARAGNGAAARRRSVCRPPAPQLRQPLGPVERQLQGLFDQHMLAGRKAALRHLEMAARRRQHDDRIDGGIAEWRHRDRSSSEREIVADRPRPLGRAADRPTNVDPVGEVEQAAGMRLRCRAEADDGDADLRHVMRPLLSVGRRFHAAASVSPGLRLQREAADREDMVLPHRGLGAVARHRRRNVPEIGQRLSAASMWRVPVPIDEEEVVRARPAGDIDIFAQLDRAFGAEDEQPPVAPGRQAVGGEPVDADIAARLAGCAAGSRRNPRNPGGPVVAEMTDATQRRSRRRASP